jgi:hypothetical protein
VPDNTPKWLRVMQNGSIGEARAKAFLIDRFWVLERSVDIDGADFIIQRRLTQHNLLDRNPTRLGVVQVKFFESDATTQYIHNEYIKDPDNVFRTEFFLLCHTGNEENIKTYLLTSEDVDNYFDIVGPGKTNAGKYRIAGKKLFGNRKFQVVNKKNALDKIEHALELADFTKNRSFMSWLLPSAQLKEEAIETIYRLPIDNYWGDIPTGFLDMKKKARTAMFDLEDIHEKLKGIVESTDPLDAFGLVEEIECECKSGYGWNVSLPDDLLDEDFHQVVLNHKHMVTVLNEHGLLDAFLNIKNILKEVISKELSPYMPLSRDKCQVISLTYDPDTMSDVNVSSIIDDSSKYESSSDDRSSIMHDGIVETRNGFIRFYWVPGVYSLDDNTDSIDWAEYIKNRFWRPYETAMEKLYEMQFGNS